MSENIKHECGIALIRLLKPLDYYREKYGTALWGLNKLYLLMEKQHNRGQDGVGVATIKFDPQPGHRYISRKRSNSVQPIKDVFHEIFEPFKELELHDPAKMQDAEWLKYNMKYIGELMMGHLRYGTHGINSIEACHPFLRQNNWMTRNLVLAGNFNMTNVTELMQQLVDLGQHPKEDSDTVTVLEKIGHFLDDENQRLFDKFKKEAAFTAEIGQHEDGNVLQDTYTKKKFTNAEISKMIAEDLDIQRILARSAKDFDGGYVMTGLIGHGDAFVLRDPNGIRPAYFYMDDEIVVAASERPAIQTTFGVPVDKVVEIQPGHALIVKKNGKVSHVECRKPGEKRACSFERIYFSRGNDKDIYQERKKLGQLIAPKVLKAVNNDIDNTIFSFIPNTAEIAWYGLVEGINTYLKDYRIQKIKALGPDPDVTELERILNLAPRTEKIAIKDVKLRTFITQDSARNELVSHVYDTTFGLINPGVDTIVAIDDSIVRGTTLQRSILAILDKLGPKKIIIVSSAPQIRYPDCYGIDMSRMGEFIAFQAAVALLKERGMEQVITDTYHRCKESIQLPLELVQNQVKAIYAPFNDDEISAKISEIVRPKHIFSDVQIIYQTIENLHQACPNHSGDWYFSGNYPTAGGNKVVNQSFINYYEGSKARAY